ncbi:putative transcription factor [Podospora australis]|uniref:Transcription factor n=1 Tax=Podospora australis TaxID=1536484 RepID=A0AAN7ADQ1_9PEZI|nr:putative transcription factor [Podospora australis]
MDVDVDTDMDSSTTPGPAPSTPTGTQPRRRNRPALSCIQCRTRKIRCDRNEPCSSCLKSKIVNCTYEESRRKPRLWRLSPAPIAAQSDHSPIAEEQQRLAVTFRDGSLPMPVPVSLSVPVSGGPVVTGSANANAVTSTANVVANPTYRDRERDRDPTANTTTSATTSAVSRRTSEPVSASTLSPAGRSVDLATGAGAAPSGNSTAALADRVQQLEQQLADALKRSDHYQLPHHLSQISVQGPVSRGCLVNGEKLFPLIVNLAKKIESDKDSEVYFLLKKCKDLCKVIKSRKASSSIRLQLGADIPPESTARRLMEAYFRTFESVYRILHQPTFWQGYHRFWENRNSVSTAFIIQFQLCMAIGTCFQDDVVALRPSASQWIYEAQAWLASPQEKSRLNMTGLQVMCLLHLARETCGVECDLTWISAGHLLRTAMYIGLHRDPDNLPGTSVFRAEMSRRLWATVLEMVLQSSLDSGGPPLISMSDFDTRTPSNYDDDQLIDSDTCTPNPRSPGAFTQTTVQLALLRSFPTRLAIAQYVNHFKSPGTYEETLKWNGDLTAACRALSVTLQQSYDPAGILPKRLSLFQLRLTEHMVHRFFLALNHRWLENNPAYYFARKMCVETSLKLYRAFATASPAGASGTASQTDDFTRLSTCGYGAFRSVPTLAVLTICLELLWQVQEDRSFRQSISLEHSLERPGPGAEADGIGSGAAPRQDLLDAVKYSIGWTARRIQMGETNIKGYLMYSALLSQVQALQRGATDLEAEQQVFASIVDDLSHCWHLLKEAAGGQLPLSVIGAALNGGHLPSRTTPEDIKPEWGCGREVDDSVRNCIAVGILPLLRP